VHSAVVAVARGRALVARGTEAIKARAERAPAPDAASSNAHAHPAAPRRGTWLLAPHRRPALPAMESELRTPRAPLCRGSLCPHYLQSARENEIGRVQRERK
jgi:hypothetical protein